MSMFLPEETSSRRVISTAKIHPSFTNFSRSSLFLSCFQLGLRTLFYVDDLVRIVALHSLVDYSDNREEIDENEG